MKIVQINETCGTGSIGRTTFELADYLNQNGHTCTVYHSLGDPRYHFSKKISGRFDQIMHSILSRLTGLQGYFSYIPTLSLVRKLKKELPDVVHLRNLHSNYINLPILLRFLAKEKIATVVTLHDCWFYTGKCTYYVPANCNKWKDSCGKCPLLKIDNVNPTLFFDRTAKSLADKAKLFSSIEKLYIVGVSKWVTKEASMSHFKNRKLATIYNWIDSSIFRNRTDTRAIRETLNLQNSDFIVLMVTTGISNKKGYREMVKLAKYFENQKHMKLIVVGRNRQNLELPANLIHVEHTHDAIELSRYYSLANVCLNTTQYETFGKVTAESLCCGTPVIVYNNTASPELVGERCGYVVRKKDDIEAIIEAIELIKKNGKRYYSKYCVEFAEAKFNKEKNIKAYIDLYQELCS